MESSQEDEQASTAAAEVAPSEAAEAEPARVVAEAVGGEAGSHAPAAAIDASGVSGLLDALEEQDRARREPPSTAPGHDATPPIDFSDTTHPHSAAAPPPTESELVIDVDASGEAPAVDEEELLVAEDLTEIEGEPPASEAEPQATPAPTKRSVPPPLPRSG
jgi:hypothetical protein